MGVDGLGLVFQPDPLQHNGLGLKGGRVENLAACGGIAALERHKGLGMGQDPLLGAAAPGHSGLHQVGAGGAVQIAQTGGDFFVKLLRCQHIRPPEKGKDGISIADFSKNCNRY